MNNSSGPFGFVLIGKSACPLVPQSSRGKNQWTPTAIGRFTSTRQCRPGTRSNQALFVSIKEAWLARVTHKADRLSRLCRLGK